MSTGLNAVSFCHMTDQLDICMNMQVEEVYRVKWHPERYSPDAPLWNVADLQHFRSFHWLMRSPLAVAKAPVNAASGTRPVWWPLIQSRVDFTQVARGQVTFFWLLPGYFTGSFVSHYIVSYVDSGSWSQEGKNQLESQLVLQPVWPERQPERQTGSGCSSWWDGHCCVSRTETLSLSRNVTLSWLSVTSQTASVQGRPLLENSCVLAAHHRGRRDDNRSLHGKHLLKRFKLTSWLWL